MGLTSLPSVSPGLPSSGGIISGMGSQQTVANADSNPDEIGSLLPLVIKASATDAGTAFPGVLFKETNHKSLAIHMYPNLDSGRVECTGNDPRRFYIKAILTNNIYPGLSEVWTAGLLFPDVFLTLSFLLRGNNNLTFQHPIYGDTPVQVESWDWEADAKGPRDGVFMDIVLVETIVDNVTLNFQPQPGTGNRSQAANSLDNAMAAASQGSLSQLFGQIDNFISQVLALPANQIGALNATFIAPFQIGIGNAVNSIQGAFSSAPATVATLTGLAIQSSKNTVLHATVNNFPSYDQSTFNATQSLLGFNNNQSQNAGQFLSKVETLLNDLIQTYINQNDDQYSQLIESLRQYLFQVQQTANVLNTNATNTQSVVVATYVTRYTITWMTLARYLNNDIDQLLGLNQNLIHDLWIPANTQVNYYTV